ncbi:MAG: hypothetical protein ABEJ57_01715 [Halobacteriaceae archaeon]
MDSFTPARYHAANDGGCARWREGPAVTTGNAALVTTLRAFAGDALRDVHVFTRDGYETLYLRDDVAEHLEDVEVDRYIDNERYGYVTRATYEDLHYANYEFTVRGFETFYQVRTFLGEEADLGVLLSVDRRDGGVDFGALQDRLDEIIDTYGIDAIRP